MHGVHARLRVEMPPRREAGLSLRRPRVVAPTAQEIIGKQTCAKSVQKVGLKSPYVQYAETIYICKFFSACPSNPRIVVDDKSYNGHFNAPRVLRDHLWWKQMYWVAYWWKGHWGHPAPPPSGTGGFTVDLGCVRQINGVRLRNSYGRDGKE